MYKCFSPQLEKLDGVTNMHAVDKEEEEEDEEECTFT